MGTCKKSTTHSLGSKHVAKRVLNDSIDTQTINESLLVKLAVL